jgi:hypothetical protein
MALVATKPRLSLVVIDRMAHRLTGIVGGPLSAAPVDDDVRLGKRRRVGELGSQGPPLAPATPTAAAIAAAAVATAGGGGGGGAVAASGTPASAPALGPPITSLSPAPAATSAAMPSLIFRAPSSPHAVSPHTMPLAPTSSSLAAARMRLAASHLASVSPDPTVPAAPASRAAAASTPFAAAPTTSDAAEFLWDADFEEAKR